MTVARIHTMLVALLLLGCSQPRSKQQAQATEDEPVSIIRSYYAAIDARDFRTAYQLWGDAGAASGQSYEQFAAGFADTKHVVVEPGAPGPMGAAAGSRYVEVPVVVRAETRNGGSQRFEGSYTLRCSVVDGATPEQRRWHIYTAHIVRAGGTVGGGR